MGENTHLGEKKFFSNFANVADDDFKEEGLPWVCVFALIVLTSAKTHQYILVRGAMSWVSACAHCTGSFPESTSSIQSLQLVCRESLFVVVGNKRQTLIEKCFFLQ